MNEEPIVLGSEDARYAGTAWTLFLGAAVSVLCLLSGDFAESLFVFGLGIGMSALLFRAARTIELRGPVLVYRFGINRRIIIEPGDIEHLDIETLKLHGTGKFVVKQYYRFKLRNRKRIHIDKFLSQESEKNMEEFISKENPIAVIKLAKE